MSRPSHPSRLDHINNTPETSFIINVPIPMCNKKIVAWYGM